MNNIQTENNPVVEDNGRIYTSGYLDYESISRPKSNVVNKDIDLITDTSSNLPDLIDFDEPVEIKQDDNIKRTNNKLVKKANNKLVKKANTIPISNIRVPNYLFRNNINLNVKHRNILDKYDNINEVYYTFDETDHMAAIKIERMDQTDADQLLNFHKWFIANKNKKNIHPLAVSLLRIIFNHNDNFNLMNSQDRTELCMVYNRYCNLMNEMWEQTTQNYRNYVCN
jgi:hypothetical protein